MKFEKVTLVEFSTDRERERINNVFKGRKRTKMLSLLERFERGEFEALARERVEWDREFAECVHPVVESTLTAVAERLQAQALWPKGFGEGLSPSALQMLDFDGKPVTTAGLPYPKFKLQPQPEGEFVNPNDVQENHGYALHVLLSMTHGLLKARAVLEAQASASPQVQQYLQDSATLAESARKMHEQLFS